MNALMRFVEFTKESIKESKSDFKTYAASFYALVLIGWLDALPLAWFGLAEGEKFDLFLQLILTMFTLTIFVNIIITKKSIIKMLPKDSILFSTCTYLIYTLYTIFVFAGVGFVLFLLSSFIPGLPDDLKIAVGVVGALLVLWLLAFVPLASVLIDNDQINYFKMGIKLVRKDYWLTLIYGIVVLLSEFLEYIPAYAVKDEGLKIGLDFLWAIGVAYINLIIVLISVKIFYYLKSLCRDQSQ